MTQGRLSAYRSHVRSELERAFSEERPPHDVATSFSVGVFVSALPNLGIALVLLVALAYTFQRVSKLALFASVIVMNPPVKWAIYAVSHGFSVRRSRRASRSYRFRSPPRYCSDCSSVISSSPSSSLLSATLALRLTRELRRRDIEVIEPFTE